MEWLISQIQWCTGRQVLIDLTSGTYQSSLSPVNANVVLKRVASTLTTCRYVIHEESLQLNVALDEKMCLLALENAATNAIAHGDRGEVRFGASFQYQGSLALPSDISLLVFPACFA